METILEQQREYFNSNITKEYKFRHDALKRLKKSINKSREEITKSLYVDLKKSSFESYATEIGIVLDEISHAISNLKRWMRRECHCTPLMFFKAKSYVVHEPLGVILIIAPWNYPFQLLMSPLVGAIAAGNCVILKPSMDAPATARVMAKIVNECFDAQHVAITDIDNMMTNRLLGLRFDHIFYTGGVGYAKNVLRAAAEYLTPVTLELGGKSPCIVESDANIAIAARRIVWGKFMNCGQTCVAPDYLMVHSEVKELLVEALRDEIERQYGETIKDNTDYGRIINRSRYNHLIDLMEGHTVICGGDSDDKDLYIAPTLLDDVTADSPIMREEIFGPLLPIIEYDDIEEVIEYIKSMEKPLSLYYFTSDKFKVNNMINKTSSGGCAINDVVIQVANHNLPFGGVGHSGMGSYHGKYSFLTFSHSRAVMESSIKVNIGIKFAPFGNKLSILRKIIK